MRGRNKKGFTLIELTVVLFIVALLLTIALPGYQFQLRKTRRSLGGAVLYDAVIRQEQFFVDHKRYAVDLTELDYPASPYAIDPEGRAVGALAANRIYLIDVASQQNTYTLFAIPQLGQAQDVLCGTLSLDSMGIKLASGSAPVQDCW